MPHPCRWCCTCCWCSRRAFSCRRCWSPGSSVLRSCSDEHLTPPCQSRRRPCRRARWLCPACDRRQRLDGACRGLCRGPARSLRVMGGWRRDAHGPQRQRPGPARHRLAADQRRPISFGCRPSPAGAAPRARHARSPWGSAHRSARSPALARSWAVAGAEIEQAARIVRRISGDSTVAYAWAFARAVEAALGWMPPPRAVLLRGIMGELERLSHHINDVGGICNDASVLTIHARCTLQREDVLAVADACFGHRLMMDRVVPGGVAADLSGEGVGKIRGLLARFEATRAEILRVYDSMPSLQDRTVTTGIVSAELARQYATGGFVGRASGRVFDARKTFAYAPYDQLDFDLKMRTAGDVDARLLVRMDEIGESLRMLSQLLGRLAPGEIRAARPTAAAGEGAALVEAFRGDVFVSVRVGTDGQLARVHARDASWFQWPLLEAAIEGNIVADFPLCNKSFNCSYSGHDL